MPELTLTPELTAHSHPSADLFAMPATPAQIRFWSLDRLNPGNPALNMPLRWQCNGPLDLEILTVAFRRSLERHESLRTSFTVVEGKLSQVLHPAGAPGMQLPFSVDDLSGLAGEPQGHETDRLARAHAAIRFDLATGPLIAVRLLRLSEKNHLLLVTMHHIICDGISNGILLRDVMAFYRGECAGREPALPELPIQFADYAVWYEQWRSGDEHERSLAYWRDNLGTGFAPLRLTRDLDAAESLPSHHADSTGDIQTLLITPDLQARANAFCADAGVTLNVLLFSIFTALLSRLTGAHDLTIGYPCANRTEETENLIGPFSNLQILRARLDAESTFADVLQQVKRWTLSACDHQLLAFEDLLHDPFFTPSRDEAGTASSIEMPILFLYQKSFMLTERTHSAAGTLTVTPLRSESSGAIFESMFAIVDREEEGPRLQLEYNPQFFKTSTIQNQLRLYLHVMDAMMASPDAPLSGLSLLSAAGRDSMLHQWNRTDVDFGPFEAVSSAILSRSLATPDRIAVECAGKSLTYAELCSRAQSLAATLVARRIRPGDLVGICTSRSPDMVVAVLAVLLTGAAYLPLDPRHPPERLQSILADSGSQLVLTNLDAQLPADIEQLPVASVTSVEGLALPQPAPDSLAYVIYTSGSTGEPKGVAVEHAALRNLLLGMQRTPGFTAEDVFLAITTLAFDIATLELLLPLVTGARLVLATDEQVHSPADLIDLLQTSGATHLQATPGAWRALIDQGWTRDLSEPVLKIMTGGDALSRDLADRLLERSPQVWNMYGPTETTIWSSATLITRTVATPRVGPPMCNTQFYVLDSHLQPLPPGLEGELYIGGAGLARGYWRKPELTASRFVSNPFGSGRIYKTGDCARAYDDGSVQLLGRTDFQVKVRGYRIEVGEIEAALLRDPRVREAVVVLHRTPDTAEQAGVNRLIAYVAVGELAGSEHAASLTAQLEASLLRTLPDYMLPNVILALESFPRNTNGKLNRKALPDPFTVAGDAGLLAQAAADQDFLRPRDILERQLTELWQSILGIDHISIRASFFSLGVGSLAALRLITRMNRVYRMDLGLASLISASSIESIAELIRGRFSAQNTSTLVPLHPEGSRPPLFIVHGVGGNVISFLGLASRISPDQPVYAVQAQSLLPGQPALLRLEDMASCYLREVRTLQPHGPYHFLGYSFGGTVALEMAHQLRAAGEEVALLGMLDARSKRYEERRTAELSVSRRLDRSVRRMRGNTGSLPRGQRLGYLLEKVKTRVLRLSSAVAAMVHVRRLPAVLKSTYDINYVALNRYVVRPFDGHMILFRAAEQDFANGARDLDWGATFTQGVEVHEVPGDHERIFLEPSIDQLAQAIRNVLERIPQPEAPQPERPSDQKS